jgi:uncharacterized protein DUF4013
MDTFTSSNLKKIFTYPFEDENWKKKLAIAGGLTLASFIIPIIPWLALCGYMMKIIKQIVEGDGQPSLPEWEDWGSLILNGMKLTLQAFIFALPLILIISIGYGAMFLPIILTELAAESGDTGGEGLLVLISMLGMGGGYFMFGLVMLLSIVLGFFQSVIIGHVSFTEQFSAAFRFGEWWRILRSNTGEFLLAFVFVMGISMLFSFVYQFFVLTIVLMCLLPFLLAAASAYMTTIIAPLYGQVYRASLEKMKA